MKNLRVPDIKIFVSHRIDVNSILIDNPLYLPVRCGAVFDKEKPRAIQGDNSGDNISARRKSFCEFTVQYWAWKNMDADYYGLCHYRRYLSFSDKRFRTDEFGLVRDPILCPISIERYALADLQKMQDEIGSCDAVVGEPSPVKRRWIKGGHPKTVWQLWAAQDGTFFETKNREMVLELIDSMMPEYSQSAREYFASDGHRGYNCYVLRRDLFVRLCEMQFPILFEVEKRINTTGYTDLMKRTPAFLGEMLYGVFVHNIIHSGKYRVRERQLTYFEETAKECGSCNYYLRKARMEAVQALRAVADPLLPLGSKRREWVKKQASILIK